MMIEFKSLIHWLGKGMYVKHFDLAEDYIAALLLK